MKTRISHHKVVLEFVEHDPSICWGPALPISVLERVKIDM